MSQEENNDIWEILKVDDDYEINRITLQIRRRSNKKIICESIASIGYLRIKLNQKDYYKHRVIAIQFIPNDDPQHKTCIDHIDGDKLNNNVLNLRWCSQKQNANNLHKSSRTGRIIETVKELPENALLVEEYGPYHFHGYYFIDDVFYKDTGNGDFRKIPWFIHKPKMTLNATLTDDEGKPRTVSKKKFYEIYDLE